MAEGVNTEHQKITEHKTGKRRISWKAIGIIAAVVLVIVGVIYGVIRFMSWRNNGTGYAEKLSDQIGVSAATAQKYAHITLQSASEYACINMVAAEYPHLFESTRKTKVMDVTIPAWVIYLAESNDAVTEVIYYDYRQLGQYGSGVKTKAHVDAEGVTAGMTADAVREYIGFAPLCTTYTNDSKTETYKYSYKDQNTGNTLSYLLTVSYKEGTVTAVNEEENYFILSVLTLDGAEKK